MYSRITRAIRTHASFQWMMPTTKRDRHCTLVQIGHSGGAANLGEGRRRLGRQATKKALSFLS
jgi:hypothetical protein